MCCQEAFHTVTRAQCMNGSVGIRVREGLHAYRLNTVSLLLGFFCLIITSPPLGGCVVIKPLALDVRHSARASLVCIYMYIHIFVYMFILIYLYMYVCIYVF